MNRGRRAGENPKQSSDKLVLMLCDMSHTMVYRVVTSNFQYVAL